jgi:diguanylate cyclase (GGDEF)-like protein
VGADEPGGVADRRAALTDEQRLRLLDTAVNPFVVIDTVGNIIWAGASIGELLGVDAIGLAGRSMLEFLAPSSVDEALRALAAADDYVRSRQGVADRWEGAGPLLDIVRADGTVVTCAVAVATPSRTGFEGYAVQLRRAVAAGALERTIEAMAGGAPIDEVFEHLATVLAGDLPSTDVVIAHAPVGDALHEGFRHVSPTGPEGLRRVLRDPADPASPWAIAAQRPGQVHEVPTDDLPAKLHEIAADDQVSSCAAIAVAVERHEPPSAVLVAWRRHDLPLHVFSTERMQRAGRLVGLALQWERGRRALEWAASHDSLTGLHNRQAFLALLAGETGRSERATSAVLYLDLDDFKPVNDRHGHALGDQVLAEVARRLREAIRPSDTVARLGGDEFAILCAGVDDPASVDQLADRLVDAVGQPVRIGDIEVTVGLSVGIAGIVDSSGSPDEILNRADDALRRAKEGGKRQWHRAG